MYSCSVYVCYCLSNVHCCIAVCCLLDGVARATSSLLGELRGVVFSRVVQSSLHSIALRTFQHLHTLDMNFHMHRNTGALNRAIDRGTRSINFVLSALAFNVLPTIAEIGLVSGILGYRFGWEYSAIVIGTLSAYITYTVSITTWRTRFRQLQNQYENRASSIAFDSLLNYETVKYFNQEQLEVERYNKVLKQYAEMAVKTQSSLAVLNVGQNVIFSVGKHDDMLSMTSLPYVLCFNLCLFCLCFIVRFKFNNDSCKS